MARCTSYNVGLPPPLPPSLLPCFPPFLDSVSPSAPFVVFTFPPSHHSPSSFFQSLCILGYCVFPLDIAALANLLVGLAFKSVVVKALIVAVGFAWATRGTEGGREGGRERGTGQKKGRARTEVVPSATLSDPIPPSPPLSLPPSFPPPASVIFIGQVIAPERKVLALFPVFFFYTFLAWLVLIQ